MLRKLSLVAVAAASLAAPRWRRLRLCLGRPWSWLARWVAWRRLGGPRSSSVARPIIIPAMAAATCDDWSRRRGVPVRLVNRCY